MIVFSTWRIRRIVGALTVGALIATSCKTDPLTRAQHGSFKNGVYRNAFWGFSFRVPDQWTVLDRPDVEKFCLAVIGNPAYSHPLFTCSHSNATSSDVLMCFAQDQTTAEQSLCYTLTSTHPTLGVGLHSIKIHGEPFSHMQVLQTRGTKPYSIDLFAIDSKDDAVIFLLEREHSPAMTDPVRLMESHFIRAQ